MDASLALTALFMGLAGGPHCLAMCGAACAALGGKAPDSLAAAAPALPGQAGTAARRVIAVQPLPVPRPMPSRGSWLFLGARLLSYAALGALAAGSMQAVAWLSVHAAALRPLWSLVHVAAALLGLALLWQARQPAWLEQGALRLWRGVQSVLGRRSPGLARGAPWALGLAWGLMPCGLLYSALLVAALSPSAWQGALVMLVFASASGLSLAAGPWLWRRLAASPGAAGSGAWAVRLAGASLFALSAWALWAGLAGGAAPWCASPAA